MHICAQTMHEQALCDVIWVVLSWEFSLWHVESVNKTEGTLASTEYLQVFARKATACCAGLARTIYLRCTYGTSSRETTKYTVIHA
jgi:hypothetical protein